MKYIKSMVVVLLVGTSLQAMSLKEALSSVMESHPIIKERMANFRQTQQDLVIADSEYYPKLDFVSTWGVAESGNLKSSVEDHSYSYYTNSLKLTQNIFNGFSTTHKVKYQEARTLAAAHHYLENVNDIAFGLTGAYLDVIRSYRLMQIAQESLEINQKIYQDVQELFDAGLTTNSEVTKVQSSLSLARFNLMVQQNNAQDKHFRLKRLLGRDIPVSQMSLPAFDIPMPESVQRATMIAMQNNPSIIVSNYNIQGAKSLYHEGKSSFYPIINFEVEQFFNDAHRRNNGFDRPDDRTRAQVTFTWNLYNSGADKAHVQKQISNIHREIEIQRDLRAQVVEGLELSYSAYQMLEGQLAHLYMYETFSKQTLENYIEEYEFGRRTLLDLLSAQNDLANARTEIVNGEFDRLYAQYRILDAMGLLVETVFEDSQRLVQINNPVQNPFVIQKDTLPVEKDSDGDGIVDSLDICPNTPKGASVTPYGCEIKELDSDHDGVVDALDQCPNTPFGVEVDARGCPLESGEKRFFNDPAIIGITPVQYDENSPVKGAHLGLYDYEYHARISKNVPSTEMDNTLMYGDFEAIKRFSPIGMTSKNYDNEVAEIAQFYKALNTKDVIITVIGHSHDEDTNGARSRDYAQTIATALREAGVDTHHLIVEARQGLDKAFLEVYKKDRALNERVLVSIYQPKTAPLDSDGDGVIDQFDLCPNTPSGVAVDVNGCPLDSDGDGVPDYLDLCPNTPSGYKVDASGCTLTMDLRLTFGVNQSAITPAARERVEAFASFLKNHPSLHVTIVGHTSIEGHESREYNIALSKARAQSVKEALVALGVDQSRISAQGKGPDMPVASNATPEGRALNRRIEASFSEKPNTAEEKSPTGWSL